MFLTQEILEQHKACDNGKAWFKRHFPEGGELTDVMLHKYATTEFLHWGYAHLPTTKEEQAIYWQKLKIDCKDLSTIYECDNVKNSQWISRSSFVTDSEYIFGSKNVTASTNISFSKEVDTSSQVFGSDFVYSSTNVLQSKNVTDSHNVVNSDYIVNSHSIINSTVVSNSAFVHGWAPAGSKQIKDSCFIMDCTNVKHCLFCNKISDAEYMIFNKQADASDYELVVKQLNKLLKDYESELVVEGEWPKYTIPLDSPQIQRNVLSRFTKIPSSFWEWIKTIPWYDSTILYTMTFNKDLLQ